MKTLGTHVDKKNCLIVFMVLLCYRSPDVIEFGCSQCLSFPVCVICLICLSIVLCDCYFCVLLLLTVTKVFD